MPTEHRPLSHDLLDEADRLMTVCNSCRYCEGLCAVFPAMELRRTFADGDLNYLPTSASTAEPATTPASFAAARIRRERPQN